jgi:hypothetical protein
MIRRKKAQALPAPLTEKGKARVKAKERAKEKAKEKGNAKK